MSLIDDQLSNLHLTRSERFSPRKKKRKYSITDNQQYELKNINIVDRVLDFSKYHENTGLYTLCRDWINATTCIDSSNLNNNEITKLNMYLSSSQSLTNDSNKFKNQSNEDEINITNDDGSIRQLPIPKETDIKDVELFNNLIKKINDNDFNENVNVNNKNELLKSNLNRWKSVKNEWSNYYRRTGRKYKETYDILKNIYEEI